MVGLITIEQLPDSDAVYIMRGCAKYGDPYDLVCTAVVVGGVAEVKGMVGVLDRDRFRSMVDCLKNKGCAKVIFERYRKNGTVTSHEILL